MVELTDTFVTKLPPLIPTEPGPPEWRNPIWNFEGSLGFSIIASEFLLLIIDKVLVSVSTKGVNSVKPDRDEFSWVQSESRKSIKARSPSLLILASSIV